MKPPTGMFKPRQSTEWTRERVDRLQPVEIRQLRDNALRLGIEQVVALCNESLAQGRPHRAAVRAPARKRADGRKLLSRRNAFEARGVFLENPSSWGGVRKSDGRVVIGLWASAIESRNGVCRYLLWAPNADGTRPWSDSPAGKERLAHCRLIGEHGKADGLIVRGEALEGYLPEDKAQSVHGVEAEIAVVFTVERIGEEYWAVWGKKAPG